MGLRGLLPRSNQVNLKGASVTEGDEMALQSQWIDLLRFEREQRMLEVAKESKEARYGSGDVSCSGEQPV